MLIFFTFLCLFFMFFFLMGIGLSLTNPLQPWMDILMCFPSNSVSLLQQLVYPLMSISNFLLMEQWIFITAQWGSSWLSTFRHDFSSLCAFVFCTISWPRGSTIRAISFSLLSTLHSYITFLDGDIYIPIGRARVKYAHVWYKLTEWHYM